MDLDGLSPDLVETILVRHGACSVTLSDGGDDPQLEPAPGETPLWRDTRITGLFDENADLDALESRLRAGLDVEVLPPSRIEALEERDWELEWRNDFAAMRFGDRLWVCPADSLPDRRHGVGVVVRLDPGVAFGTGTHATTALCLEWLDGIDMHGKTILDYGCGSGILAIAALKLGAARAAVTDIDPQALAAARRNAARNGVADRLEVLDLANVAGRYDIVVANILAGPLVELAPELCAATAEGGHLVLSGLLARQRETLETAYAPFVRFDDVAQRVQDGQTWLRLSGSRVSA